MIKNNDNNEFFSSKDSIDKASINIYVTEFVEIVQNYPKAQKEIKLIVDKNSNESYEIHSQIGQTAVIQKINFEEAKKLWEKQLLMWTKILILKTIRLIFHLLEKEFHLNELQNKQKK